MSSDKITIDRADLERVRDSLRWCRQWGTGTPAELETERCITILDAALAQPAECEPRRIVDEADLLSMDCPFPPEPEGADDEA